MLSMKYDCGGLGCGFQPCICDPLSHDEAWRQEQLRLLATEQKLAAAGIVLDDLIDLIDARRNGKY